MVEISYEGQVLWLVGVYASNVSQEQKLLWRSLYSVLDNGGPSLLMGDFNVVVRQINQHLSTLLWMDQRLKSGEILRVKLC